MSVSSIGPTGSLQPPTPAQPVGQPGFLVPVATTPASSNVLGVAQPTTVGASVMLALQERAGAEAGDQEARQHGRRLLEALAELQRALLSGNEADTLQELSRLSEEGGQAVDPVLAQVIRSIRLRARLELARAAKTADRASVPGS